jgi:hypothetical protein
MSRAAEGPGAVVSVAIHGAVYEGTVRPAAPIVVTIEVDGVPYDGEISIEGPILTVRCPYGRAATHLGGVARRLLRDILNAARARGAIGPEGPGRRGAATE